jgi:RimJ/RimL family protein N-acetyltransferase
MMPAGKLEFVEYTEEFLRLSWDWLRDPEIKALIMAPDFTREEQLAFFKSLPVRSDFKIEGIAVNGEKAGACGLKNIEKDDAELWCYLGLKKYWGAGLGSGIVRHIEAEARKLQLSRLYLKVSWLNPRALRSYEKNGYSVLEELERYCLMGKQI